MKKTTFPQIEKILNLCIRWHIFRSYRFVVDVAFTQIACEIFQKMNI